MVFLWFFYGNLHHWRHLQKLLSAIVEAGAAFFGQLAHVLRASRQSRWDPTLARQLRACWNQQRISLKEMQPNIILHY